MDHGLVLLWIRPNGEVTFGLAQQALPDNTNYGFEPADRGWSFEPIPAPGGGHP